MKTLNQNSRRDFLSTTVKSAVLLSAGTTLAASVFSSEVFAQQTAQAIQTKVAMLGQLSLQTSRLAIDKASHAEVKNFATFEAAEQEAMAKVLKDLGTPAPVIPATEKAVLIALQTASGAAFDKAFMQAQVDTHKKLHQAVSQLSSSSNNAHIKHVAALALTTITEHTERGQALLQSLK